MPDSANPNETDAPRRETELDNPVRKTGIIAGHFPETVRRQLRMIAAREGRTSRSLIGEALNDLFRKRGELPIAPE